MTYIQVTDTRRVSVACDDGALLIFIKTTDDELTMLVHSTNSVKLKPKELLDALVALYPDNVAYNFEKEEENDDIPF